MPMRKMGEVIEQKPSKTTIYFAGKPINLCAIERAGNWRAGSASRFFNGVRGVSVENARKLAAILGMELVPFLDELDKRVAIVKKRNEERLNQHLSRVMAEDEEDLRTISTGKVPKPRLPGMRLL